MSDVDVGFGALVWMILSTQHETSTNSGGYGSTKAFHNPKPLRPWSQKLKPFGRTWRTDTRVAGHASVFCLIFCLPLIARDHGLRCQALRLFHRP